VPVASPEEARLGTWGPGGEVFVFHSTSIPQYLFQTVPGTDRLFRLTGPGPPNPDLENTTVGRWSPSGDRILDAIEAGTPREVSIMDADGSNACRIVDDGGGRPVSESEKIAYVSCDERVDDSARRPQIFVMTVDGSSQRTLTDLRQITTPSRNPLNESSLTDRRKTVFPTKIPRRGRRPFPTHPDPPRSPSGEDPVRPTREGKAAGIPRSSDGDALPILQPEVIDFF